MRLLLGLLLLAAAAAQAQDALRGKRYYLDAGRLTASGVSCVDCHGGLPGGAFGIGRAANNPQIVENAVNTVAAMAPFRGRLSGDDFADLAAFIGDPAVASPDLRLATLAPAGASATADRIDFGATTAGASSSAATLNLINTGQRQLRLLSAPRIEGSHADDFAIVASDCADGATLLAQQSCRVDLVFRPTATDGLRTAAARIDHDWVGGTAAVALIGTALPAAQSMPPSEPLSPPIGDGGGGALDWLQLLVLVLAARFRSAHARRSSGLCRRC